ncbi:hypothetical protein [Dongia sedimenti]|uniref:hypothetical protein n=1 Tax=Dongia sedimenti TaxID=3064282 RepID=UPI0036D41754
MCRRSWRPNGTLRSVCPKRWRPAIRPPWRMLSVRPRGMAKVARLSRFRRESLTKALSGSGNPELATVLRVAKALGLELAARPVARTKAAKPKKAKRVSAPRRLISRREKSYSDPDSDPDSETRAERGTRGDSLRAHKQRLKQRFCALQPLVAQNH